MSESRDLLKTIITITSTLSGVVLGGALQFFRTVTSMQGEDVVYVFIALFKTVPLGMLIGGGLGAALPLCFILSRKKRQNSKIRPQQFPL